MVHSNPVAGILSALEGVRGVCPSLGSEVGRNRLRGTRNRSATNGRWCHRPSSRLDLFAGDTLGNQSPRPYSKSLSVGSPRLGTMARESRLPGPHANSFRTNGRSPFSMFSQANRRGHSCWQRQSHRQCPEAGSAFGATTWKRAACP